MMEQFFDLIFGILWWQWLLGMAGLAGLYYVLAAYVLPYFRGMQDVRAEASVKEKQQEAEREKQATREEREAVRREYLRKIPSGPVQPVNLPEAMVRLRGRYYALPRNTEFSFGTRRGVSVAIMSRGVSRDHAKIRPEPRGYVLYDLLSEAGTFVGGQRIESHVLADGDRIRLGPVDLLFKLGTAPQED